MQHGRPGRRRMYKAFRNTHDGPIAGCIMFYIITQKKNKHVEMFLLKLAIDISQPPALFRFIFVLLRRVLFRETSDYFNPNKSDSNIISKTFITCENLF
jgi:hypothetical protein